MDWKGNHKTVFAEDTIVENLKELTKINDYSKLSGYKVNKQKSTFSYVLTRNQQNLKLKHSIIYTIKNKYSYINLRKYAQDLNKENYKNLKEI